MRNMAAGHEAGDDIRGRLDCVYPYRSRERGKKRKEAEVAERLGGLEAALKRQQQQINELTSRRS